MTEDERVRPKAPSRSDASSVSGAGHEIDTTSDDGARTTDTADARTDPTTRVEREITAEYHDEFYVADPGDTEVH